MIRTICNQEGYNFCHIKDEWDMPLFYNWADLVITLGRGVLEAMACGREVLIYDHRSHISEIPWGDGMARDVYPTSIECGCSGRALKKEWSPIELGNIIKSYDSDKAIEKNRQFILENHNVMGICAELSKL